MNKHLTYLIILIIGIILTGCYSTGRIPSDRTDDRIIKQDEASNDSLQINTSNKLLFREIDEAVLSLPIEAKLDTTAKLLEHATDFRNEGEMFSAGYLYAMATLIISSVNKDSIGEYSDFYSDLLSEIRYFYSDYVAEVDTLPEESPLEIVIAGAEEAEADTAVSLQEVWVPPEVEFDSSAIDSAIRAFDVLPPIPIIINKKVENSITYFQTKGRKVFTRYLERGEYYIPMLKEILRKEGMPEDLVYLSMIESGFKPYAYSYAHASGLWQFIKSTGKIFDLEIDYWYDERRDPEKSTYAAIRYLKKLYVDFDDWYLALASYNCGEGRVSRHIKKYNTRNYWELKRLPRQTRNYIPLYLAAATIAKNPTAYGFKELEFKSFPPKDSVFVTECIDLEVIAGIVGSDIKKIRELNYPIRQWCTPPNRDSTKLYLPHGTVDKFITELPNIPREKKRRLVRHVVKKNETLSGIASGYGTTIKAIRKVRENKIYSSNRIYAGKTLLIPIPSDFYKKNTKSAPKYVASPERDKSIYTVRKGDNLTNIARRYGTTVASLRQWNKLYRSRYIHPGQKLTIWVKPPRPTVWQGDIPDYHTVKRGENLSYIAKRYGVSLNETKSLNKLTNRSVIHPGDKVMLPSSGESPAKSKKQEFYIYTIKKSDNLWTIAQKNSVSVYELKRINRITNHRKIKPGDKIKIPISVKKTDSSKATQKDFIIPQENHQVYIVRKGDTLWDLAKEYNVSIAEIKQINGIKKSGKIKQGQKIKIPVRTGNSDNKKETIHIVKRGDTLWDIARAYGVSVDDIRRINRIAKKGKIKSGDKIIIPEK
ncbi:MAG: LysM peptidoglycan-binding domain-containing protein [Candidatus Hatepunaea meridiana]|nr:LysM peptidoglycan-binding domain-containing protein [Candidatus Hatepunaea meridiana]